MISCAVASRLGKAPASSLAKAMRLTIERKPGGSDRVTEPLAEAIDRERLAVLGIDNRHVVALGERPEQRAGLGAAES